MGRGRKRRGPEPFHGLLLVDKPCGMSSFAVIAKLRKRLGASKIGHTGTLDPAASGLLVLCFGSATRLSPYLTAEDKRYTAAVSFGRRTDTLDREGEENARDPIERYQGLSADQVAAVLPNFIGAQEQLPPIFSAIQQGGERAYARARRGEEVKLAPRPIEIYTLALSEGPLVDPSAPPLEEELPTFTLDVHCSKGTYIRSLARDLGDALGLSSYLSGLRRDTVGRFALADALSLEEVSTESVKEALIPLAAALPDWPLREVSGEERLALQCGREITRSPDEQGTARARAVDTGGRLIALLRGEGACWRVQRGFPEESDAS